LPAQRRSWNRRRHLWTTAFATTHGDNSGARVRRRLQRRRPMSPMFKLRSSLSVALSTAMAFSPGLAYAQYAPADAPGAASAPARHSNSGGRVEGAHATGLALPLGKAAIVDLPDDARDVLLSNPEVADAVVRTARRVYVIGRAIGQTNAFFFDA